MKTGLSHVGQREPSVIPGFGITLGFTTFFLCAIVLIPLMTSVVVRSYGWTILLPLIQARVLGHMTIGELMSIRPLVRRPRRYLSLDASEPRTVGVFRISRLRCGAAT